ASEQPSDTERVAMIQRESFTRVSAGKCSSHRAINVTYTNPPPTKRKGMAHAWIPSPQTKPIAATLRTRAIGSLPVKPTIRSDKATAVLAVVSIKKLNLKQTAGL